MVLAYMDSKFIGKIIRFHRKKSGLSQEELGMLAQVGKTTIFDVEHGKLTVQLNTILRILDVLNIKLKLQSPLMNLFEKEINEES